MIRLKVLIDTINLHYMENFHEKIIHVFIEDQKMSSSEIHQKLVFNNTQVSLVTVKRILTELVQEGLLNKTGAGRSVVYTVSQKGLFLKPFTAESYVEKELDIRNGKNSFSFDIFEKLNFNFFTDDELQKLNQATKKFKSNASGSATIFKREMERFIIEMSWKSSKIEGNTYTLLDTELLIREGIRSNKNTESETRMILNHKKALELIFSDTEFWKTLSVVKVEMLHALLVDDLGVTKNLRKRPVGITGTSYRPIDNEMQIKEALEALIITINTKKNIFEKALLAIIGISYIQPFEDGNKRTGRLLGNALLLCGNMAPLSYRNVNEAGYRSACLVFYEQNSIEPFKKIFIEQYVFAAETYNISQ